MLSSLFESASVVVVAALVAVLLAFVLPARPVRLQLPRSSRSSARRAA